MIKSKWDVVRFVRVKIGSNLSTQVIEKSLANFMRGLFEKEVKEVKLFWNIH